MLLTLSLVHCVLVFITTTLSQHIQYPLTSELEQRAGLDESKFSQSPLLSLLKNLVNIESISGNEQAVGDYLEAYIKSHNYTVERQYLDPLPRTFPKYQAEKRQPQKQRFNLLVYPGEHRQTPVLLSSVSTLSQRCSRLPYRLLSLHTNHIRAKSRSF